MKLLWTILSETDMHGEVPLYESIVRKLNHLGLSGATVFRGIMGFGSAHQVHRGRLFGVSDDRPVAILVFDEEQKIRAAIPELRALAPDALMIVSDAEKVP